MARSREGIVNFFVGEVLKILRRDGRYADPKLVREVVLRQLDAY